MLFIFFDQILTNDAVGGGVYTASGGTSALPTMAIATAPCSSHAYTIWRGQRGDRSLAGDYAILHRLVKGLCLLKHNRAMTFVLFIGTFFVEKTPATTPLLLFLSNKRWSVRRRRTAIAL
jgi:hypothetical protein